MPCVFINYRSGDEEASARLIERELSRRFGSDKIFWDSKTIRPGQLFEGVLLDGVRRSGVLVAVMGSRWFTAAQRTGQVALDPVSDWTCREIAEAFARGIPVIPVLVGDVQQIDRAALPPTLIKLASCQFLRLTQRGLDADLVRLGDALAEMVPELTAGSVAEDSGVDSPPAQPGVHMRERGSRRRGGVGNITGNIGTLVTDAGGPVNTGSGNQFNLPDGPAADGQVRETAE